MSWLRFFRTSFASVACSLGAAAFVAQAPGFAQTASDIDPLADFRTDDDGSELFGGDGATSSGVFGLIHSLQLTNDTNLADFNERRSEDIQSAAENFRDLQMQRIEAQDAENELDGVE